MNKVRQDFPMLQGDGSRKRMVYFDNACQSLRPKSVLDAISGYYLHSSSCGGRSMHRLAEEVTRGCESVRISVAKFIRASRKEEIVFTRNTTEAINLVAQSLRWQKDDVVVISDKEHNSNLLPWQKVARQHGVTLKVIPSRGDNTFDLEALERVLDGRVKLVALGDTSNLDGVSIPQREIIRIAHRNGSLVLLDAAQTAPRTRIDVKSWDVDFLAFSGHKMLGPSGTGVLYGKYHLLEQLDPFLVGGGTVAFSTYDSCSFLPPPEKFEAGLQDFAGILGLGAAISYLEGIGFDAIAKQELLLNQHVTDRIQDIAQLRLIGPPDPRLRGGILSFFLDGVDSHRVALMLDQAADIMVRSGEHCVHSWFDRHGISGSVRASFYFYNTVEEADLFVDTLHKICRVL